MKSKFLKKLFAIFILITLLIQSMSTVLAVALSHDSDTTADFGITDSVIGQVGSDGRITYRTYVIENNTKIYENAIYCLNYYKKFPTEKDSDSDTETTDNYKSLGDFKGNTTVTVANKAKIQTIAEAMYIPGQTDKDNFLYKIFETDINNTEIEPPTTLEGIKSTITDTDIILTQQYAIWYFTDNITWPGENLYTLDSDGKLSVDHYKIAYMKKIYDYLISDNLQADEDYITTTSIWQATSNTDKMQILLYISKEEKPKVYDAALTKSIIAHKKAGETTYTNITNRTPSGPEEKTTSKDAYTVSKGDYLQYKITVYNEGTEPVKITGIEDYLPEGIEIVPNSTINSQNWTSSTKNDETEYYITNALQNILIYPRSETESESRWIDYTELTNNQTQKASCVSIIMECKVSENITTTEDLINYAEIVEMKTEDSRNINGVSSENTPKENDSNPGNYHPNKIVNEDDTDFEIVEVEVEETEVNYFDLALNKYVSQVNGVSQSNREEMSKTSKENSPVEVSVGDLVIFTIKVKNEGTQSGYVTSIKDYLPEGLGYLPTYKDDTDGWSITNTTTKTAEQLSIARPEWFSTSSFEFSSGTTANWNNVPIVEGGQQITINLDTDNEDLLEPGDSKTIQIACIVTSVEDLQSNTIKNIAEITGHKDTNKNDITDKDSTPGNYETTPNEDDDNFDVLRPKVENGEYDLALKKFVSAIEGIEISPSRLSDNVDVTPLQRGEEDAIYTINKTPVGVKVGDTVTFTIRVYNEGTEEAYAEEITDTIPEGLQFIGYETTSSGDFESGNRTNYNNGWIMYDEDGEETTDPEEAVIVKTTKLSRANSVDNVILPVDYDATDTEDKISYKEVKIEFRVLDTDVEEMKNVAKITDDSGDDRDVDDIEDDDTVVLEIYDLALQKFVTELDDSEVEGREPEVSKNKDGELVFTSTDETVTVFKGNIVTYTIRVYNVGNKDAYAAEIIDDIPEGLEFLPDNDTNKEYGWIMLDEDGNETDDIEDAVEIKTTYLSKDDEQNDGENLIKAFDKTENIPTYENDEDETINNPDYRDIKVAFEVIEENATDSSKKITNTAELTETTDDEGEPVEEDETNNKDDETIELKCFDLALQKYVSKVIVTEDGQTKETETGYTGDENPEPVVKVEINKKKISTTMVKYVYTLKVTNQGEIEGYANEITDRIPAGMAFYSEDNTEYGWEIKEDGIVTTDYLRKTLLEPGESATVQITLRWENSENNFGKKINVAEISEAENEYGAKDKDSTPGNNVEGEDDQDDASIMISITTGSTPMYIGIVITAIGMLGAGAYSIKRYVL